MTLTGMCRRMCRATAWRCVDTPRPAREWGQAILDGYASVIGQRGGHVVYLKGKEGTGAV